MSVSQFKDISFHVDKCWHISHLVSNLAGVVRSGAFDVDW